MQIWGMKVGEISDYMTDICESVYPSIGFMFVNENEIVLLDKSRPEGRLGFPDKQTHMDIAQYFFSLGASVCIGNTFWVSEFTGVEDLE